MSGTTTTVAPARRVAARVLRRVSEEGAFADLALEAEIDRDQLDARDGALATEIALGVLRWQRWLDALVAPHSRRPVERLDPPVLTALRMAVYQLAFLDRVPARAAVHDAVELVKPRAKPGVAEFVNAVLRGFARRGVAERNPALPADPVERLAVRCSFPTWLCARWVGRLGALDAERLMLAMNERPPLTLRTNTLRTTREALAARLEAEEGVRARPTPLAPEGLDVEHGGAPGQWQALVEGDAIPQDQASILVGHLLAPQPGDVVGDACAAPGTKTTHLAALMRDTGKIVALDPQRARLALVDRAAWRLGVTIVETREGPVEALAPALAGRCDRVLVDAPCSNLGVLRRNPEVKWRRRQEDIALAAERQRSILTAAAWMVRDGGRLVYATCSLEPEENDEVVRAFLAAHRDWKVDVPTDVALPLDADGVLRCLPHVHGTDGFTAMRLRRAP